MKRSHCSSRLECHQRHVVAQIYTCLLGRTKTGKRGHSFTRGDGEFTSRGTQHQYQGTFHDSARDVPWQCLRKDFVKPAQGSDNELLRSLSSPHPCLSQSRGFVLGRKPGVVLVCCLDIISASISLRLVDQVRISTKRVSVASMFSARPVTWRAWQRPKRASKWIQGSRSCP